MEQLLIRSGTSTEIQFLSQPMPDVRVIHWERHPPKWIEIRCSGDHCEKCITGGVATRKFEWHVQHEGRRKLLSIPRELHLQILRHQSHMGRAAFFSTLFAIHRTDEPPFSYTLIRY